MALAAATNRFHAMPSHAILSLEPFIFAQSMRTSEASQWRKAADSECGNLMKNEVWKVVDRPKDQDIITGQWVLKRKIGSKGEVI